jgi:MFS family permease
LSLAATLVAVALVGFVLATKLGLIMGVSAVVFGIGWGLFFANKLVVLARISTNSQRFQLYTFLAIAIMAGYGLSPVAGAWIVDWTGDIRLPFALTAALCLVSAFGYYLLRKPVRALEGDANGNRIDTLHLSHVGRILRSRALLPILLTILSACEFSGMNSFQAVFAQEHGLSYADWFLSYTVTVIGIRFLISGKISPANAEIAVIILFGIMTLAVGLFGAVDNSVSFYVLVAALFGLGYGVSSPIVQTLGANLADAELLPQSLQVLVLAHLCGVFGFPLIAGWLLAARGATTLTTAILILSLLTLLAASLGSIRRRIQLYQGHPR